VLGAALRAAVCLAALAWTGSHAAVAQEWNGPSHGGGDSWSGYQRKSHHSGSWNNDWKHDQRFRSTGPDISAGSFQRPYPYHMDYYKMKYGGSYAPYFGNLYGPPTFVGVPFYGGFGAGTFNPWGWEGGFNGYPPGGVGYPAGFGPNGSVGPGGMPPGNVVEEAELPVEP
jgi:hypothetical protein